MADQNDDDKKFTFEISLSVLNHLDRSLYRSFATVMGEAISNAWDADSGRSATREMSNAPYFSTVFRRTPKWSEKYRLGEACPRWCDTPGV
jgi:hypothetical protein